MWMVLFILTGLLAMVGSLIMPGKHAVPWSFGVPWGWQIFGRPFPPVGHHKWWFI